MAEKKNGDHEMRRHDRRRGSSGRDIIKQEDFAEFCGN